MNGTSSGNIEISKGERLGIGVVIILISIAGLFGNSLIILAVTLSRKLQTSTNVFVTSLAVTDLVTSFFWFWFALSMFKTDGWLLPQAFWICQLTAFMLIACTGTSLYTLGAIGINRLILITKPTLYRRIFTSWSLCVMVLLLWVIPGGVLVVFLLTGNGAIGYDQKGFSCSDLDTHEKAEVFNLGQLLAGFPIPVTTILVSYLAIYFHFESTSRTCHKLHLRRKILVLYLNRWTSALQNSIMSVEEQSGSFDRSNNRQNRISRQQIDVTKNLFLVVCAFFACFLPFNVTVTLAGDSDIIERIAFYTQLGIQLNSSINFVIYSRRHPDFKIVLGHLMTRSYDKIPQPSSFLKFLQSQNI